MPRDFIHDRCYYSAPVGAHPLVRWIGGCECGSLHAFVRPDRAGLGIGKLARHHVVVGQPLVPHEIHLT